MYIHFWNCCFSIFFSDHTYDTIAHSFLRGCSLLSWQIVETYYPTHKDLWCGTWDKASYTLWNLSIKPHTVKYWVYSNIDNNELNEIRRIKLCIIQIKQLNCNFIEIIIPLSEQFLQQHDCLHLTHIFILPHILILCSI